MYLHKDTFATRIEIKKEFTFSNDSLAMYPLLNEIITFFKIHLPSEQYAYKIGNCKQILIELLTNAVKHSGVNNSVIKVSIQGRSIEITKSDKGNKLDLNKYTDSSYLSLPLEKKYVGEKVKIQNDNASNLYAIVKDEYRVVFDIENYSTSGLMGYSGLREYYGFLTIAKFSNEFFYSYNRESNSNLFTAIINV
jgi:hypothetical protein